MPLFHKFKFPRINKSFKTIIKLYDLIFDKIDKNIKKFSIDGINFNNFKGDITKDIVWTWNVFDHFNMEDYDQFGGTWTEAYISLHYDWTHVNAVIFDENESALYISTRHLSRITKIDYPSGDIIWNMGHQMSSDDIDICSFIPGSSVNSIFCVSNHPSSSFISQERESV